MEPLRTSWKLRGKPSALDSSSPLAPEPPSGPNPDKNPPSDPDGVAQCGGAAPAALTKRWRPGSGFASRLRPCPGSLAPCAEVCARLRAAALALAGRAGVTPVYAYPAAFRNGAPASEGLDSPLHTRQACHNTYNRD